MQNLQVAERYARSLLEVALEAREGAEIEKALASLSTALKASPDLERFLSNPRLAREERSRIVKKLFHGEKGGETLAAFVDLLFRNRRFEILHEVVAIYKEISDKAQGEGTVAISSAAPLSPEDERRIVEKVEKIGGFKAEVHKTVDPSLIGGVVVRFNNKVLDGSVKNRLALIKKELTAKRTV